MPAARVTDPGESADWRVWYAGERRGTGSTYYNVRVGRGSSAVIFHRVRVDSHRGEISVSRADREKHGKAITERVRQLVADAVDGARYTPH